MGRVTRVALICLVPFCALPAQQSPGLSISGDTSGAPRGCTAKAAVDAIELWFKAYNTADSAGLARALAPRFVVSTGKHWIPGDTHRRFDNSLPQLLAYARARHRVRERLILESVHFYGWRGTKLGFMPRYSRSADDLGPRPLAGLGKAEYWCRSGIRVLNLAPATQALR